MKIHRRLQNLERRVPKPAPMISRLTDQEWLQVYEALGRQGFFVEEPEFPQAFADYRRVLDERALMPPAWPPGPGHPPSKQQQEVDAAWGRLAEMFSRVYRASLPVSSEEELQRSWGHLKATR